MTKGKKIFAAFALLFLAAAGIILGIFAKAIRPAAGEQAGGSARSLTQTLHDMTEITGDPRAGFPAQDRVTILCMGIDDNWTDRDQVYTKQARTDTLFLLTLDLNAHKAAMLSIPRDTYAHIAGTHWNFKVNAAYETGGPLRSIDTVQELLGVRADHYLVLNIDATKKMVDALGGVDVFVEHEMHYHDKWGHLSIDLLPGEQHLNGDQAVGFARYRHADAGKKSSPEDGDERRMYRQHVLLKAMAARAKTFANASQAPHLIDVAMSTIRTDLTRTQLFDLAAIFHNVQPEDIQTASLPGDDFRGPSGAWFYRIDPDKAKAYVDWLVRGNDTAARRLVSVVVKNGTHTPGLAQHAVARLKAYGFTDVTNGGNAETPQIKLAAQTNAPPVPARTTLLDDGVPDPQATSDIAAVLGLTAAVAQRHPLKPNKLGWTPPVAVTVTLGRDYAALVQADAALGNAADTVPTPSNSDSAGTN